MIKRILTFIILVCAVGGVPQAHACTSLIASGRATASGRPLLWKHRDTGARDNFLYRVEAPGEISYVGLFNGGDTLNLTEAWMGMNDAGFAVMNTVAYNLPENDEDWIDREGIVMDMALRGCRTVEDFAALLDSLPRPMGVRTNFGCIDACGGAAYFETDDNGYTRFDVSDSENGVLVRTNYAMSGTDGDGMGYIRYDNVEHLLGERFEAGNLTPRDITEGVSRSFYHSLRCEDAMQGQERYVVDLDFVPRRSSTASIVVEGVNSPEQTEDMTMWSIIGYPACSPVEKVTLTEIPEDQTVSSTTNCHALASERAIEHMKLIFPIRRGNGSKYIDLNYLRPLREQAHQESEAAYNRR